MTRPDAQLLPISTFSRTTLLSAKALRLYDQLGLLKPAYIDPDSGYRYYRPHQLREANLIRYMRRMDMPLATIREVVESPAEQAEPLYKVNGTDLLLMSLSTHRINRLTSDQLSSVPTTNGRYIAWQEASTRFAQGAIMLLDRTTGVRTIVSARESSDPKGTCQAGPGKPRTQCD